MNKESNVFGEYRINHNPGYDFLRLLTWMDQIDPQDPRLPFGPYLIETIAVISACCALEGYLNMVGKEIDKEWNEFDKGFKPVKDKISHIYQIVGKEIDFGIGLWQEVLCLFKTRASLVHPRYNNKKEICEEEIPDLFQEVNSKYPTDKTKQIAEDAIDLLLLDTGLTRLRNLYLIRAYSGPPRL